MSARGLQARIAQIAQIAAQLGGWDTGISGDCQIGHWLLTDDVVGPLLIDRKACDGPEECLACPYETDES